MSTTRATGISAAKREGWGSLRKLPSGRWQARYPAPDGETYPARTLHSQNLRASRDALVAVSRYGGAQLLRGGY